LSGSVIHVEPGTIWVVETFAALGIAAIAVVLGLGIGALLWRWQHGQ
jgi:hypothetical protein